MCSTKLSFKRDIYRYLITQNYGRVYSVLKNLQNRNTVQLPLVCIISTRDGQNDLVQRKIFEIYLSQNIGTNFLAPDS